MTCSQYSTHSDMYSYYKKTESFKINVLNTLLATKKKNKLNPKEKKTNNKDKSKS